MEKEIKLHSKKQIGKKEICKVSVIEAKKNEDIGEQKLKESCDKKDEQCTIEEEHEIKEESENLLRVFLFSIENKISYKDKEPGIDIYESDTFKDTIASTDYIETKSNEIPGKKDEKKKSSSPSIDQSHRSRWKDRKDSFHKKINQDGKKQFKHEYSKYKSFNLERRKRSRSKDRKYITSSSSKKNRTSGTNERKEKDSENVMFSRSPDGIKSLRNKDAASCKSAPPQELPGKHEGTLELRKIPAGLNSISYLEAHFGKFGKISNIMVEYEGSPDKALVTFTSYSEANIAYSTTEAVLGNRFIKVLWHNPNKSKNVNIDGRGGGQGSIFKRLGTRHVNKTFINKDTEMSVKNKLEKQKAEAIKLKAEMEKRKQQLMKNQMQQLKILINRLETNKSTMKPEEIKTFLNTIKSLQSAIDNTRDQILVNKELSINNAPSSQNVQSITPSMPAGYNQMETQQRTLPTMSNDETMEELTKEIVEEVEAECSLIEVNEPKRTTETGYLNPRSFEAEHGRKEASPLPDTQQGEDCVSE
ncbi:unnamed protein product [Meganyctiphanes norvegica]|uniref:RRM domain-containing protein n=1 Tax=Meganyctiphanes norvegica TaxID=48144 RepID=A0AAV2QI86_MEGNR